MILNIFSSIEILLKIKTVMLHFVTMSESFPFLFGSDLNMMLKLQKPRPTKIPIQNKENLMHYWMICKTWKDERGWLNAS